MLGQGGPQYAFVDQGGNALQQFVLADHVRGLEYGAGEHQLPVQRQALALQGQRVEPLGVVDECQAALWFQRFDQVRIVPVGMDQAGDPGV